MSYGPRTGRRLATILTALGLATIVATGTVYAGTPVTVGYRDHSYGGGAFRPAGDKPQSKLWYTDGSWFAGMFHWRTASPPKSQNEIWKLTADGSGWVTQNIRVDTRDTSHADYYWDEGDQTLWVASVTPPNTTVPPAAAADGIWIYQFSYDAATNTYACAGAGCVVASPTIGVPVIIPGTTTVAGSFAGGAHTVTIDRDSGGRLWAAWPKGTQVMYSISDDDGATWSTAAQVPAQGANTINQNGAVDSDTAAVIAFGTNVGIMWSDQDSLPAAVDNGYYFARIAAGADPAVGANWTLEALPDIAGTTTNSADNHINIKAHSDGTLYMVGKTNADTTLCATNKASPLIPFYDRTTGGTWTAHLAGTVGDCNTRPQVVISEQLDVAYLFLTSPNGGGTIYQKSAPLSGPDAFVFRGVADQTLQRGIPFIKSATETLIDDPSATKQAVTATSGIAVIANNLTSSTSSNIKVYLHNVMAIPATDSTGPAGTVSINGGAATATSTTVSVAVPATDTGGSGMSLVRLSNSSDMSSSTTLVYTTPISWTLAAGADGPRTVYVQWRDAAGNWSGVSSDTINLNTTDTIAPTKPGVPSHAIFGSGRFGIPVRVTWAASTDNAGAPSYHLQYRIDGGLYQDVGNTTTNGWSIDLSNSAHTYQFRVRATDGVNFSAFAYGPVFRAISYSESSTAVKFTGSWGLSTSPVYVGGKARVSSTTNGSATLAFTGNRVGWLSRTGPQYGTARVYIDGSLVKTINLNAATVTDRKLVFVRSWSAIGNHTIRIVVAGTAGHPAVVYDQVFVLR